MVEATTNHEPLLKTYLHNFPFLFLCLAGVAGEAHTSPIVLDQGSPVSLLAERHVTDESVLVALGELAFKSEVLLEASRSFGVHVSCDSCHPDGGTTKLLFIQGLSGKPGTIDITNRAMTLYEDGSFNPVNVPSIFGARHTPPYSRSGNFPTLRDFTRFVVVEEFGGIEPGALTLDALVAYEESLNFLQNSMINEEGKLSVGSSDSAKRGEQLFWKPFSKEMDVKCATCHDPKGFFVDGKKHDVGTGVTVDTPTLRDLLITAPYMHDGRFDSLVQVVAYFDEYYGLVLTQQERGDLVAYLEVIGGGEVAKEADAIAVQLETVILLLKRTIQAKDWALGKMVTTQALVELNAERAQANPKRQQLVDRFISALGQIDSYNKIEKYAASMLILSGLEKILAVQ